MPLEVQAPERHKDHIRQRLWRDRESQAARLDADNS